MQIIAGGRQSGRTKRLIEMAAESEAKGEVCYIVCHSRDEATRIANIARRMNLKIGFPITYGEFLTRPFSSMGVNHVYIDNVEMLLQHISVFPIKAITITVEGG